jgi:putative Mg2+ transporter-C (MgtC) family protein
MVVLPSPIRGFQFDEVEQFLLASGAAERLLVACALGSVIGIEREYVRKSLGWRTNLLICCGCAMFTFLSAILAGDNNPDKRRVASNIVQGIGFLGAGLILHDRNRVSGLTNAATVFVVASIGMACGAGLYVPAIFATAIVLVALVFIGFIETRWNVKPVSLIYEIRGGNLDAAELAVLRALDRYGIRLAEIERDAVATIQRLSFPVLATHREHQQIEESLRANAAIDQLLTFHDLEDE